MLNRNDQAERSAAAGRSRLFTGSDHTSAGAAAAGAASGCVWTTSTTVIPTTKRHALNPAPRPEEAVSP